MFVVVVVGGIYDMFASCGYLMFGSIVAVKAYTDINGAFCIRLCYTSQKMRSYRAIHTIKQIP